MVLVKTGKDDGKVIETQSNFAKLGARYTCRECKNTFVASTTNDVQTKVCPSCR